MKTNISIALATVLVAFFLMRPSRDMATAQDRPAAQKWEYRIVLPDYGRDGDHRNGLASFNKLGDDGWELCVNGGQRSEFYIFKRPKR